MKKIEFKPKITGLNQPIISKRYLSTLLATLAITICLAPMAKAEYIERVACSSTGQVCDKTADYTFDADGRSSYILNIKAPNRHCSAVKYSLNWRDSNRSQTATTDFLNREESATIPLGHTFASGKQVITIGATGQDGGCNAGALLAWGVEVTATPKPPESTPKLSESTPKPSEPISPPPESTSPPPESTPNPSEPTPKPSEPTSPPPDSTPKPSEPTPKPSEPTSPPPDSTPKPSESTP
jgi:hypothetical protein